MYLHISDFKTVRPLKNVNCFETNSFKNNLLFFQSNSLFPGFRYKKLLYHIPRKVGITF